MFTTVCASTCLSLVLLSRGFSCSKLQATKSLHNGPLMGLFYCCVPNCTAKAKSDVSLFRFPRDPESSQYWVHLCGREDLINFSPHHLFNNYRVCALHFDDNAFSSLLKNRLKRGVLPTRNLSQVQPRAATTMAEPSTSNAEEPSTSSSVVIKEELIIKSEPEEYSSSSSDLNLDIKQEPQECKMDRKTFMEFCKGRVTKGLINFVNIHLNIREKNQTYDCDDYKIMCLTLYFMCTKSYKIFSFLFGLPSKSTLYHVVNDWHFTTALNEKTFQILDPKVGLLTDIERDCCLCVGQMSLRKFLFYNRSKDRIIGFHEGLTRTYVPARSVLVLMVRGISSNWEQPVAYYFVDKLLAPEQRIIIIFQTIRRLLSLGLNVVALNCDQTFKFTTFAKFFNITKISPFFFVSDKKIFFIYDVPFLLTSLWRGLFKYQLKVGKECADKQYIQLVYENDKLYRIRLVQKLTDDHLNPTKCKKVDISLPAQLFSARVAASINTYVALGVLPPEANFTAIFIDNMDKLFDIFNSRNKKKVKEFNKPFIGSEEQLAFFRDILEFFKTLKVRDSSQRDVTGTVRFVDGWKITITSFLLLWEELKERHQKIYTRHLNQECLTAFFEKIRRRCGKENPAPYEFERAFRRLFCAYYFKYSTESNDDDDAEELLRKIKPSTIKTFEKLFIKRTVIPGVNVNPSDYLDLKLPKTNALFYISAFLLGRTLRKHTCHLCVKFAKDHDLSENEFSSCLKLYQKTSPNHLGPPKNMIEFVYRLEIKFHHIFPNLAFKDNIAVQLRNELKLIQSPQVLCDQFDFDYLLSLYVRMRIFFSLKFINKDICNKDYKITVFKMI